MKQTEIGLIPDDWEVKNINKECTIKARIGWQGLKSTEYLDYGNYILITGTDFNNGFINWKSCSYVTKWRFNQDKNIQIKQGDVLVTKDGTIGKIAFLGSIPMQGTLNSGVFVVRPKNNEKIDSVFLSLIFKSLWFDSFLEQITSGSTIVHLYQKDFVKFDFPLPPLPEQRQIAKALSDVDALISTTEKLIQKKKNIKQGTMQNLLTGKKRLPGFAKSNNTKMTEQEEIPEDWEVKRLGEICDLIKGDRSSKYPKDDEMVSNGIPFINAGHLKEGAVDFDEMDYITRNHYQSLSGAKIREGDILFCLRGSLGKNALVDFNDGAPASSLCVIRHKTINEKLLFQIINSALFEKQIIDANSGSSQPNLSAKEVSIFLIPTPTSKEEQTAISNVLSSMDKEIETLNTKLEKYRNLKTAMMQQLLTGKIRLV